MFATAKRRWNTFAKDRPGERFRASYERQQRRKTGGAARVLWIIAGIALLLVGVFFLVVPGPGLPIVAIGAALIASRSRPMADALDWIELKLRRAKAWLWRKTGLAKA